MKLSLPLLAACLLLSRLSSAVPIGSIQGTGDKATPGTYTIAGVVTAVYANLSPAGFYVQDETATADGNSATSDALFVVQTSPIVSIGDRVSITGTVQEDERAPSFGQAVLTVPSVTVLSSGNPLPWPSTFNNAEFSAAALERYEGMRVQFSGTLTVTDQYNLRSRGELTLSTGGLCYQPTQFIDPNDDPSTGISTNGNNNLATLLAYQAAAADKTLLLDDGSAQANPQPTPYLDARLHTLRIGSTISQLRGIMSFGFGKWRLQPLPAPDAPVLRTVRPPVPAFGRLDLKLASFNVHNYFNGDGDGGGFPTARGARTAADFARQRAKIIAALRELNADIVGLTEMENDGNGAKSALQDLVNGLNAAMGTGTYAFVNDGGATRQPHNADVIHNAIIYKPAIVARLGPALLPAEPALFERPPLAQLFLVRRRTDTHRPARADTLAFIINHFKSKASGSGADADQNDGQGGNNARRRRQAQSLVRFINKTVIPAGASRVVSAGDYNANYEEDPLDVLRAAGFVPATPPISASFVYRGFTGSLDHAVVTSNLIGFVDVRKWPINSGEPYFLEYDVAGEAADTSSPFRSSDHDPVLIGINFSGITNAPAGAATASRLFVYPNPGPEPVPFSLAGVPASAGPVTIELHLPHGERLLSLHGPTAMLQQELSTYTAHLAPGIYMLRLRGTSYQQTQRVMKE